MAHIVTEREMKVIENKVTQILSHDLYQMHMSIGDEHMFFTLKWFLPIFAQTYASACFIVTVMLSSFGVMTILMYNICGNSDGITLTFHSDSINSLRN